MKLDRRIITSANEKIDTLFAIILILGVAALFFLPLAQGRAFSTVAGHLEAAYPWRAFDPTFRDSVQSDQADLSYPWQVFITASLRSGSFPMWNPYSFAGQPFFANGSSAVLYPPRFLAALILPPDWAHDVLSVLHLTFSGIAMWLLLRELKLGSAPSSLGAIAWMLCPFNTSWLHLEVVAPVQLWLPTSLFFSHRALERSSNGAATAAVVALACTLLSGHLLFMGLVYGIVVSYSATLLISRGWRSGSGIRRDLPRMAVIVAGPFALAAIVLLPTVMFLDSLGRDSLPYSVVHVGVRVPFAVFANLLWPPMVPPVTERLVHEMAYVGRPVALLAVIGFFSNDRRAWPARVLVVLTVLVATDTVILKWVYLVLPQFSFFAPLGRLLNLFDFGVIMLGAIGLETTLRWVPWPFEREQIWSVTGSSPRLLSRSWTVLNRHWMRSLLVGSLLGITAVELVFFARNVNPPFPPREERNSYWRTPFIRALGQELSANFNGPGRLLPLRAAADGWTPPVLFANESMVFGFESAGGYDSTLPSRSETIWRIVAGESIEQVLAMSYRRAFSASFDARRTRLELLPRFGVTTIVTAPEVGDDPSWQPSRVAAFPLNPVYTGIDGRIYRIVGHAGGPHVVSRATFVEQPESALRQVLSGSFDYRAEVIFETRDLPLSWRSHAASGSGTARVVEKGINTEEIDVRASAASWVVIPTSWEPGWRAEVNDEEVPVVRANYAFQAVPVPPGQSRLRLWYRPRGLTTGLTISLCSVAVLVTVARRGRRMIEPPSKPQVIGQF